MRYYRNESGVIATIGTLDLPEISKEEFDAEMERVQREIESRPVDPAPPTEAERLAALENQLAGIVSAYREGVNEA